jgi:ferredoxin/flavodoxin
MRIAILTFSSTGNTKLAARMLKRALEQRDHQVKHLELGRKDVFYDGTLQTYLAKHLPPHDLLLVGGPVYMGHLQKRAVEMIRALPQPDGNGCADKAAVFVTWGGRTTGVALKEGASLLARGGRVPVAGLKFLARHAMSNGFDQPINAALPGSEAEGAARQFAEWLGRVEVDQLPDASKQIGAQRLGKRIEAAVFTERLVQTKFMPDVSTDPARCQQCRACVKLCPVQVISMSERGPVRRSEECIHCGECYFKCPHDAVLYQHDKFAKQLRKAAIHVPGGAVEGEGNTCLILGAV